MLLWRLSGVLVALYLDIQGNDGNNSEVIGNVASAYVSVWYGSINKSCFNNAVASKVAVWLISNERN
jgi:hypothetical protein